MILNRVPRRIASTLLKCSALVCVAGMAGYTVIVPTAVESKVNEQMRLVEESPTFGKWVNVSEPIFFSVYMFNITNPDEFMEGEKPILQQLGPYVYQQKRRKVIYYKDENIVTYGDHKTYHFMPQYSVGPPEEAMIYTLNIPLVSIASLVERAKLEEEIIEALIRPMLDGLVSKHKQTLIVYRSVSQMLFEGYEVPMVTQVLKLAQAFMPSAKFPATDRFGLMLGKNDTADQLFTVGTGAGNTPFAKILSWNNKTKLTFWGSEKCNRINGTDGGQFPPFMDITKKLYVFSTDLCRSIFLEFEKLSQVKGIETKRFVVPEKFFASAKIVEENRCFCESPSRCRSGGVISIKECRGGLPIMLSAPHFFMGEPRLIEAIGGLHPNKDEHETFLDVFPFTGLVLRAAKRLQINIDLQRTDLMTMLMDFPSRVIPIGWIEERMEATVSLTDLLNEKLIKPQQLGLVICVIVSLSGGVVATIAILYIILYDAKCKRSEKLNRVH